MSDERPYTPPYTPPRILAALEAAARRQRERDRDPGDGRPAILWRFVCARCGRRYVAGEAPLEDGGGYVCATCLTPDESDALPGRGDGGGGS